MRRSHNRTCRLRQSTLIAAFVCAVLDANLALGNPQLGSAKPSPSSIVSSADQVDLCFTEELADNNSYNNIKVLDPSGGRVDQGAVVRHDKSCLKIGLKPLSVGRKYTVVWQAINTEGRKSFGSYTFSVKGL